MNLARRITAMARLPREARDTLFLLAVVACCIAPLAAHIPPWASAMAATLLAWRGWLAAGGRPLPARRVTAVLLGLAVALTLVSHRTIVGRDAGVTLIVMLLALKTLELRARRDAMVVFFLGFFTLLANFFFSQSLSTAAAMLAALLGLLTALVNAHMPVGRPPLALAMRTAGRMALLGAPVMVLLFVLFPRMAPLWGMPADKPSARSGLSGQMRIGSIASLVLDDSVAMRVRFDTPGGNPPPQSSLYFRGPVLTAFDGRDWYALSQPEAYRDGLWTAPSPAHLKVQGEALRYEVTLEPSQRPWLLTLDAAQERPKLPPRTWAAMSPELSWSAGRPITSVLRYRAASHLAFTHGPARRTPAMRPYVQLPDALNPRTHALARQMRADPRLGSTQALVDAALARLRTGGYTYTLEPGVYESGHTADEFWFDRKEGFCEHIASAFVVLMRAMDVPARIVTGYQGGDMNGIDGYWTVRQSDAHAWAEVWMEGRGWVRVDPTGAVSPSRIGQLQRLQAPRGVFGTAVDAVVSPTLLHELRAAWEAVNNGWNQWVLNYTQGRQLDLLKSLGLQSPGWQDLVRLMGLLACAAASIGLGWALWERRRQDPWQRLLQRSRERLARAGLELPPHLPPRAMAEQARARLGPSAEAAAQWLLRLEQARYAPRPAATLPRLRRELTRLRWPTAQSRGTGTP